MNVEGGDKGGGYSFIAIDNKKWDTVQKTGPWSPTDLSSIEIMHNDMKINPAFTEMIVRYKFENLDFSFFHFNKPFFIYRKDDNILYGYQCGNVEIFYQQSNPLAAGLPPPSDIMGSVGAISKRRLERDHSIVML